MRLTEELATEMFQVVVEDGKARFTVSEYAPYFRKTEAEFIERWQPMFLDKLWGMGLLCGRPYLQFDDTWPEDLNDSQGFIYATHPWGTFTAYVHPLQGTPPPPAPTTTQETPP